MIFLDAPVGTGFSYARTVEAYNISDTLLVAQIYTFLRKWLLNHPQFHPNQLYISGDSYSGIIVPLLFRKYLMVSNEAGMEPKMNLKGYTLGNPLTDKLNDINSRVPFAHRVSLLSDELYECIEKIYLPDVLEPKCATLCPRPNASILWDTSSQEENFFYLPYPPPQQDEPWCRDYHYLLSYIWANDRNVQNALHIREMQFESYTYDVFNSIDYHQNLSKKGLRALIYCGDHDMVVPYIGTQEWIASLDLNISDAWKPWFVDGQVAGFRIEYSHNKYQMTYATVKGGGHTAPEYKPKECFAMVYRWFAYYFLYLKSLFNNSPNLYGFCRVKSHYFQ
ncbi:hypothetical protein PVL29_003372 [Vitis rotundifolia]|uniref:Serine carboxypeptidase-like 18 n=1 Tax=Vitis rotundifolia TaxID=103349 RepID=A0AA39AD25_VITRO|nr:hypothetical protein PVL29_003372 [Vitis rotundifolia]